MERSFDDVQPRLGRPAASDAVAGRPRAAGRWRALTRLRPRGFRLGFALEILAVQLVGLCAFATAVQLLVGRALAQADDTATTALLRELYVDALRVLLWVAPLVALVGVVVALRFCERLVSPVERLRRSLRSLAEGDTGVRARYRPDELLAGVDEDFNRVADAMAHLRRTRPHS